MKNTIRIPSSAPAFNVLLFSTFWALQIFFAKLGFNAGASVLPFQLLITVIAFFVLAVLILPRVRVQFSQLFNHQKPLFWKLYLANGIQAGFGTSLAMVGIALTDAVNAGFLVKFTVVTTILFAWVMLKEKITPLKVVTVLLMILGVYLLTTQGQALIPRTGDIFLLAACVCWSSGSVLVRKFLKDEPLDPDMVTMQKPLASFPIILVLAGIAVASTNLAGKQGDLFSCCKVTSTDLIYGLLTGFCLAMAWIFIYRTLKVSTASYLTLMSMLTPVMVSVLAILFLGESLVWIQAIGAGLIIFSGIVIYYSDMAYV
jgi:drug/metabolite transporter (DMT)-like permease